MSQDNEKSTMPWQSSLSRSLFLWKDRTVYIGPGSETTTHVRHYITIIIAIRGTFRIGTSNGWRSYAAAIIPPDLPTAFEGRGAQVISIDFPPEHLLSKRFLFPGVEPYALTEKILSSVLPNLRSYLDNGCERGEVIELCEHILYKLTSDGPPRLALDTRVARALECFRAMPTHRFSAAEICSEVSLSSSRFSHVFREQVGLPVRTYLLELRVREAMIMVGQGKSLTTSAHSAGFADSAHLTRTFRRMTGLAPSALLKHTLVAIGQG